MTTIMKVLAVLFTMCCGGIAVVGGQAMELFPLPVEATQAPQASVHWMYLQPGGLYILAFTLCFGLAAILWIAARWLEFYQIAQ